MKIIRSILCLVLASSPLAFAQAPATPPPPVPTTHILAIGHLTGPREKAMGILPQEVRDTVRLFLAGKIDQWFSRTDGQGVVFIVNASTVEEAHAMLEKLPLGQAKMMEFELIPLGPLSPLNVLLQNPPPGVK